MYETVAGGWDVVVGGDVVGQHVFRGSRRDEIVESGGVCGVAVRASGVGVVAVGFALGAALGTGGLARRHHLGLAAVRGLYQPNHRDFADDGFTFGLYHWPKCGAGAIAGRVVVALQRPQASVAGRGAGGGGFVRAGARSWRWQRQCLTAGRRFGVWVCDYVCRPHSGGRPSGRRALAGGDQSGATWHGCAAGNLDQPRV